MTKLTHITADLLREHKACSEQVELFEATFGPRAKIGPRNWAKAIKAGLDVFWLSQLLPATARAEYERVRAPAYAEYDRVAAPAWAEYERVRAPAYAEYERVTARASLAALLGAD